MKIIDIKKLENEIIMTYKKSIFESRKSFPVDFTSMLITEDGIYLAHRHSFNKNKVTVHFERKKVKNENNRFIK